MQKSVTLVICMFVDLIGITTIAQAAIHRLKKHGNNVLKKTEMNNFNKSIFIIFTIFLLASSICFSQKGDHLNPENDKLMNAAREIMTSAKTCALITLDDEGRPRVRTMDPFLPESDFTVWFGTNPKSRKADQIKKDPRVTLYYLQNDFSGYVMIHGMAEIINNQIEKEKRWKAEWETFYPNKSEDFVLIKVSPDWMEVLSYPHGVVGDSITWEPPKVIFDSK